jgi:hypothetical protein
MKTAKQNILLFPVLLLLAATSCKKAEVTPSIQEQTLSTNAQNSSAAAITFKDQTEIDLSVPEYFLFNSCTGEFLRITSGIMRTDMHGMTSEHAILFSVHTNIENLKLVSLETGMEYTGNLVDNFHYNFPLSNPVSIELSETISVVLTTPGGNNNSKVEAVFHFTVTPNNSLTAWVDNFRAGCQ